MGKPATTSARNAGKRAIQSASAEAFAILTPLQQVQVSHLLAKKIWAKECAFDTEDFEYHMKPPDDPGWLEIPFSNTAAVVFATAPERCEAMLRCLGK